MGYSIHIGNVVLKRQYDDIDYSQWEPEIERIDHPDAPEWPSSDGLPDISGKSNGRHPGYCQMSDWARRVGLYELWLGEEGLLRPHPGCAVLKPEHLAVVTAARVKWEGENPSARPGWGEGYDSALARLLWYEWWFSWALENCARPGVSNG